MFESASVEGVPSGSELFDNNMRLIVGGIGGKGGYAVWIAGKTSIARLHEDGWVVELTGTFPLMDPLQAVGMYGGHGGNGARVGGNGDVGGYLGANLEIGQDIVYS